MKFVDYRPFAADPEKNTIWDNTYEEEVNHTDSTKSSYEYGTKTSDFLNVTSVCSTSELNKKNVLDVSFPVKEHTAIGPEKVHAEDNINTGESLISFVRKLRCKSIEQHAIVETMGFTSINKLVEDIPINEGAGKENISTISVSNKSRNISGSATKLTNDTMEVTSCITDKENVNPLISDLSLVTSRRNCLGFTNSSKYFADEDMDLRKFEKESEEIQSKSVNTIKYESVMELTSVTTNENNKKLMSSVDKSGKRGKQYTVECTANQLKRKTMLFNEAEGNMDFTIINNTNLKIKDNTKETGRFLNQTKAKEKSDNGIDLSKTVIFNNSENDMEFTNTFPAKIKSNINENNTRHLKKDETICFDNSGETMEFTSTYQSQKDIIKGAICFDKSECNMGSTTLPNKINSSNNNTILQLDDMEITTALSTETIENNMDVDLLSTSNKLKCDMSFTQNLPIASLGCNISSLTKNDKSTEVCCKNKMNLDDSKNLIATDTDNTAAASPVEISGLCGVKKKPYLQSSTCENTIKKKTDRRNNINEPVTVPVLETDLMNVGSNQNSNLQTSTNSNILYSEPMKLKLKTSKFVPTSNLSANINLDGTTSSFHMNLSTMSSCTEDTQQLLHATFSKSETLKILNKKPETSCNNFNKAEFASKLEENRHNLSKITIAPSQNDSSVCDNLVKTDNKIEDIKSSVLNPIDPEQLDINFIKMINESHKSEKSCFLEDITPLVLIPEEFDHSVLAASPNKATLDNSLKSKGFDSSDLGNYTFRSQQLLANISKYLLPYEPKAPQNSEELEALNAEIKENNSIIEQLCKLKNIYIVDLEEKHKQDMEKYSSSISDVAASTDEDSGASAALQSIAPKTIRERICELAKK